MNNDFINEELSAYLDGESDDPASVGQVLRQDPDAARRYAQFSALSAHLRDLPVPSVPPAFATRVLAHVREEAEERASSWFSPRHVAWTLAGLGFVVVLVVSLTLFARTGPPDRGQDPNALRMASPADRGSMAMPDDFNAAPPDEFTEAYAMSPEDEYQDTLASVELLEEEEDTYTATADLDTMLDSLSENELQAFKALLAEYAEGSRSI